jgi:hypothetical protein
MLKAVTGFTLPDNTRVEANEVLEDGFTEDALIDRLVAKGALIRDWTDPVIEADAPADEVSDPDPTPTTRKRSKGASDAQAGGEES